MYKGLTQKELGQRLSDLRKNKGLSQKDLAKRVNISRPSLAQIELGNRGISILEMQHFSMELGFSLDDFIAKNFNINEEIEQGEKDENPFVEERISKPNLRVEKFKNILLYILEKCAGKPNVGETVLYKLLYFSDFNYYEIYEEQMTGALYKKLPYGPVPQKITSVINQMIKNGAIKRFKTEYHGFQQTRYLPLQKADLSMLKASETEVIDKVIEQMGDWSAAVISNYSHKDLPWQVTEEGQAIGYELSFYREAPYSVRIYNDEIEEV